MIARDPAAAAGEIWDPIVVGGGVYGISLALEAARRGMRPLLVERDDFGGATSWNSLRIAHGGLRYLQSADLRRHRESVAERARWLRDFPDLVAPLPCLMPLYGEGLRRPSVLRAALAVNDRLSRGRNEGLAPERRIPDGRVLGPDATRARFPGVRPDGLRGGALWHDAVIEHPQRLLIEMLRWAVAAGATALNYVEVTGTVVSAGRIVGLEATDRVSGTELMLRGSSVVCCAGPWAPSLAATLDREPTGLYPPTLACNVWLDRPAPSDVAIGVSARRPGSQVLFLYPWRGGTLAGTSHAPWPGPIGDAPPDGARVRGLVEALAEAVPGWGPTMDDVVRVLWGYLPAERPGEIRLASRESIVHHGPLGGPAGLFSVRGVKFTTARLVAEKTLGELYRWRGAEPPGPAGPPRPEAASWTPHEALTDRLERDAEATREEIGRLVRDESVVHLDDLLLRRTDWGMRPTDALALGPTIAPLLGWDAARRADELRRLETAVS